MTIPFRTEDGKEGILIPLPKDAKNPVLINSHDYTNSPRIEHSLGGIDLSVNFKTEDLKLLGVYEKGQPIKFPVSISWVAFNDRILDTVFSDFASLLEKAVKENTVEVNPLGEKLDEPASKGNRWHEMRLQWQEYENKIRSEKYAVVIKN